MGGGGKAFYRDDGGHHGGIRRVVVLLLLLPGAVPVRGVWWCGSWVEWGGSGRHAVPRREGTKRTRRGDPFPLLHPSHTKTRPNTPTTFPGGLVLPSASSQVAVAAARPLPCAPL